MTAIVSFAVSVIGTVILKQLSKEKSDFGELNSQIDWGEVKKAVKEARDRNDVKSTCNSAFYTIISSTGGRVKERAVALGVIAYFSSKGEYCESDYLEYKRAADHQYAEKVEEIRGLASSIKVSLEETIAQIEAVAAEILPQHEDPEENVLGGEYVEVPNVSDHAFMQTHHTVPGQGAMGLTASILEEGKKGLKSPLYGKIHILRRLDTIK